MQPKLRFQGFHDEFTKGKISVLSDISYGGGTPKTTDIKLWNGAIPWIQSSDLNLDDVWHVSVHKKITSQGLNNSATKLIPKDSLAVVLRVGVGKLAFMPYDYCTSQDFISLVNLKFNYAYTTYLLYRKIKEIKCKLQGTSIKGISKYDFLNENIFYSVNLREQSQIAKLLKTVDKLIELHQQKQKHLQALKQYFLQKLFVQGKHKRPEVRFQGFHDEWQEDKLLNLATLKTGENNVQDAVNNGKYIFFDRSNVVKYLNKFNYDEEAIIYPGEGSKFIPVYFKGKYSLHQRAYSLYDFKPKISGRYLFYYLLTKNRDFIRYSVGTTVNSLRRQTFKAIKIYLPSLAQEQSKIADLLKTVDKLIELHQQKHKHFQALKTYFLQNLFC